MISDHRYFIINKPYGMVSQFISSDKVQLLGNLNFDFPEGTHAIGRLDSNSEGLLILTTNKKVTRLLFQGDQPHTRTYLVEVNGIVCPESLQQLQTGVSIKIRGDKYWITTPCEVTVIQNPDYLFVPVAFEKSYPPYSWLRITLTEGKFHQVRKMVAAVHHKCRRLVRVSIEELHLGALSPGSVREVTENDFFKMLKIEYP